MPRFAIADVFKLFCIVAIAAVGRTLQFRFDEGFAAVRDEAAYALYDAFMEFLAIRFAFVSVRSSHRLESHSI